MSDIKNILQRLLLTLMGMRQAGWRCLSCGIGQVSGGTPEYDLYRELGLLPRAARGVAQTAATGSASASAC